MVSRSGFSHQLIPFVGKYSVQPQETQAIRLFGPAMSLLYHVVPQPSVPFVVLETRSHEIQNYELINTGLTVNQRH